MGGRSSNRSSTSTTEISNTTNENISGLDNSDVYSDINGSVNILDGGAIDSAFGFGRNSLDFAGDGLDSLLDFGSDIIEDQNTQLTNTLSSINAANANTAALESQHTNNTIKTIAKYALYGVGAFAAYKAIVAIAQKVK